MRKLIISIIMVLILFPAIVFGYGEVIPNYTDISASTSPKGHRIYSATLAPVDATAGSYNLVVASTSGKSIRVLAYDLTSSTDNNVRFQSATGSAATTGDTMYGSGMTILLAKTNIGRGINIVNNQPVVLFQTATSGALYLNVASVGYVGANVWYFLE